MALPLGKKLKRRARTFTIVVFLGSARNLSSSLSVVRSWLPQSDDETEQQQRIPVLPAEELAYSPEIEHLQLFDWERKSAFPPRTCSPPDGIPEYCCLGSVSLGGEVRYLDNVCLNNPENMLLPYQTVDHLATHFLQQHPLPKDTLRKCDACQIVHTLLHHNLNLAFLGDSMIRQQVIGLECELRRRGYNVTTKLQDEEEFELSRYRYQWSSTYHLKIVHGTQQATIRFFQNFRPNILSTTAILDRYPIDILVFDQGLHYSPIIELDDFRKETGWILDLLKDRVQLKVWRETSAQHFDAPGGHYTPDNELPCVAVNATGAGEPMVHAEALKEWVKAMNWTITDATTAHFASSAKLQPSELVVIPFRDFTLPLHDLHPKTGDCSHYCSTPSFWLPIWRPLRLAMDREWWQSSRVTTA